MKKLLWVLGLLACNLPDVETEGMHVRVEADPGLVLCGGTVAHMDRFVELAAEQLRVTAPTGDDRFTYYWFGAGQKDYVERSGCPYWSGGCSSGREVFSQSAPLNHEFVHALSRSFELAPPFFSEGLAVAYEGLGSTTQVFSWPMPDVWRTIDASDSRGVDYAVAGTFVRYLVERYGAEEVRAVIASLPYLASVERMDRAFRAALGVTLADSIVDFEVAYAGCEDRKWTAMLVECDAPEIVWDGVRFVEHRTLACAQEDAVGPYFGDDLVVFRTLEVEVAGSYEVTVIDEGEGTNRVAIAACGGCAKGEVVAGGTSRTVELGAGRHSLRWLGPALADTSVGLLIQRR